MPSPKRLRDIAFIAMHRIHHQLQGGINNGACFFGIEVSNEIGRAFDVGKQGSDAFALTIR